MVCNLREVSVLFKIRVNVSIIIIIIIIIVIIIIITSRKVNEIFS